jgi:hypothetical protein
VLDDPLPWLEDVVRASEQRTDLLARQDHRQPPRPRRWASHVTRGRVS